MLCDARICCVVCICVLYIVFVINGGCICELCVPCVRIVEYVHCIYIYMRYVLSYACVVLCHGAYVCCYVFMYCETIMCVCLCMCLCVHICMYCNMYT